MATRDDKPRTRATRATNNRKNVLTVLGLTDREEYFYRFFNDVGQNLITRQQEGYEFVTKAGKAVGDATVESARGTDSLLKKAVGFGITAYLMKIPMQTYKDYKLEEQEEGPDAHEQAMKESANQEGRFGKIEIDRK